MLRAIALSALAALACATATEDGQKDQPSLTVVPPCHVAGCSGQICSDRGDVMTTCEWRQEYACYRTARCEPQGDGQCGWTQTRELAACIEAARGQ